jgi:dephospho-CoA kinase
MIIIGITGTLGAGKGTIVEYLVRNKGFIHFSVRDFLLEEIRKRGLSEDRDSMFYVANDLRSANGPSYVIDQLYLRALRSRQNCAIESIRTPGEIESLRKKACFFLFAVDADPRIRYERIIVRQSVTDRISFETFLDNEAREKGTGDENKQNLNECIRQADFIFTNNDDKEALFEQIEKAMMQLPLNDH